MSYAGELQLLLQLLHHAHSLHFPLTESESVKQREGLLPLSSSLSLSHCSFILVATGSHGRNKNKRWKTATETTTKKTKTTSESSLLMLFSCFSCLSGLVASCGGERLVEGEQLVDL